MYAPSGSSSVHDGLYLVESKLGGCRLTVLSSCSEGLGPDFIPLEERSCSSRGRFRPCFENSPVVEEVTVSDIVVQRQADKGLETARFTNKRATLEKCKHITMFILAFCRRGNADKSDKACGTQSEVPDPKRPRTVEESLRRQQLKLVVSRRKRFS